MSDENDRKPLRGLAAAAAPPTPQRDDWGDEDTVRPTSPPTVIDRDPVVGSEVSGYVIRGRLGSGGMGIVYEGEQPVIGKRVAIKVLRPEVAGDPDVVRRLVAEARAVNQVGHRGIIDVFGFGELPDGRHCIVMEYLEGESLEHLVQDLRAEHRVMPLLEVLVILDELLSALAAAHSAGVVHRDLKPSNIFLCRQRDGTRYVKVLDFGIAKLGVVGATPQTNASLMVGTPAYMAPEQASGGMVSPALDLYAVGCIAYELLTGEQPFKASSVVQMVMKHQEEPAPRPSARVLSLPDTIDDFVLKLMEKKPERRYQTADEARRVIAPLKKELSRSTARMAELSVAVSPSLQLEAVAERRAPATPPGDDTLPLGAAGPRAATQDPPPPPSRKGPLFAGLGLAALIAVGGVVAFGGGGPRPRPVPAVPATPRPPPEPTKTGASPTTPAASRAAELAARVSTLEQQLPASDGRLAALQTLKARLEGASDAELEALAAQVSELERAPPLDAPGAGR